MLTMLNGMIYWLNRQVNHSSQEKMNSVSGVRTKQVDGLQIKCVRENEICESNLINTTQPHLEINAFKSLRFRGTFL